MTKLKHTLFHLLTVILMNFCISSTSTYGAQLISPEEFLRGTVVSRAKWQLKDTSVPNKKYYVFYMGAKWCPPCHSFTKTLRAFYDEAQLRNHDFEIIYVSLDASSEDMIAYMRSAGMPWPAIERENYRKLSVLHKMLGRAPPALLVMDREGNTLISSYEDGVLAPPLGALQEFATLLDQES